MIFTNIKFYTYNIYLNLFSDSKAMSTKRVILPPKRHGSPFHILFYLPEEHKYIELSTASTLLPKTFDLNQAKPLEAVSLKDKVTDGVINSYYLYHSNDKDDISLRRERLQRMIDSGRHIDKDSSLNFLNSSFCEGDSQLTDADSLPSGVENSVATNASHQRIDDQGETKHLLMTLNNNIVENTNLQKEILKELQKCRRNTSRILNSLNTDKGRKEPQPPESLACEPEVYEGFDLTELKPHNMDLSAFGLKVARKLWTDDELATCRLLPRRDTGRKNSLCKEKSEVFRRAIMKRFHFVDEEDIIPAVTAVNQLGSDLSRGKRKRLSN